MSHQHGVNISEALTLSSIRSHTDIDPVKRHTDIYPEIARPLEGSLDSCVCTWTAIKAVSPLWLGDHMMGSA